MEGIVNKIYRKNADIVSRNIASETILVPVRSNVQGLDSIYTLNETGAKVWQLIDGKNSITTIIDAVVSEFEVEPKQAQSDIAELLENLLRIKAVKEL